MIFHETWQQVLDGKKTQTRRLVKEGDFELDWPMTCVFREMKTGGDRLAWRENQIYAVQSGRGKHAVGHIGIIDIRREKLQDITWEDCKAEGIESTQAEEEGCHIYEPHEDFAELWKGIHPKGKRWEDNPEVWVLEFELVND